MSAEFIAGLIIGNAIALVIGIAFANWLVKRIKL